jgi:hypothetical protein
MIIDHIFMDEFDGYTVCPRIELQRGKTKCIFNFSEKVTLDKIVCVFSGS